jgi:ribulose-phosphate 3-epimerase
VAEIIPGILEKEWSSIERKIEQVLPFAKTIQVDVIDGKFSNEITFIDPQPFKKYTSQLLFECHLMVNEPISYVEKFAKAGFKRFIGHIEKMSSQKDFIDYARGLGEAGLAIDTSTSLEAIDVDFNYPDCFLAMSVKAGHSGQVFLPEMIEKIKTLRDKTANPIEVDGGAHEATVGILKSMGVNRIVVTSGLFGEIDVASEYQKLRTLAS